MVVKKLSAEELRAHKGISFIGVTINFICHDGKGNIFMAKRSINARDEHGRWDFGGGGLKHGETVEEGLHREVLEEYGAVPLSTEFLGYYDAFRKTPDGQPTHWLALPFTVLVDRNQVKICEPEMFDDSGWFRLDNLPTPVHSQFPKFFEIHGDKLKVALGL